MAVTARTARRSGRRGATPMTSRLVATLIAVCALLFSSAGRAFAEDFWMLFQDHRVTLVVRDMTVSRILDRWSQIGGTVIVNSEAILGGPVSLQLSDVPEREALDILLRGVDGYLIAERDGATAGVSTIGKILILPKSASPRSQSALNAAALDRPGTFQPIAAQPEQAFVPTTPDVIESVPPVAGPAYVPPGLLPIPVLPAGTARPGETAPQAPAPFRSGATPTAQPGQAPPMVNMIQTTGPGATPPPAVIPGAP